MNRPQAALSDYEKSFNSLYGAARSAELLERSQTAARYYAQLVKNCEAAPSGRPELSHAKELLAINR